MGLLLAGFAGLTSCDDAPATSLPQENPQGPVLEGFTGATATLSSTLSNGINLDQLLSSGTETLNAFSVSAGASELEVSQIWGEFEVAGSELFNPSIIIDNNNGVISVADLAAAQKELFGNAPGVKTVFFRIPLFATVNGTDYRIGSLDYYGGEGIFASQSVDPGFTIQSHYYIIGTGSWDPMTDCVELNHSSASPYDDPVFTFSVTTESGFWWKIVPQNVYEETLQPTFNADTDFWPFLIGTENDGDEALEGILVETNAQSGHLVPGTWTMSFNMKDYTYSISGSPLHTEGVAWDLSGIFLRGGFNGWGEPVSSEFVYTDNVDNGIYVQPYATIPGGDEFKIADSGWSNPNLGSNGSDFELNTAYALVDNAGNLSMPEDFTGWSYLTKTDGEWAVIMTPFMPATAGEESGIFIRGDVNGWADDSAWEFQSTDLANVWTIENVTLPAGNFKVADTGWGPINMGATNDLQLVPDAPYALFNDGGSGNIYLDADFTGTIRLVYIDKVDKYFLYLLTE